MSIIRLQGSNIKYNYIHHWILIWKNYKTPHSPLLITPILNSYQPSGFENMKGDQRLDAEAHTETDVKIHNATLNEWINH